MESATTGDSARAGTAVAELTPGQAFAGDYVCARKDRLTARNGSAYLSLELRDRTGTIPARQRFSIVIVSTSATEGTPKSL